MYGSMTRGLKTGDLVRIGRRTAVVESVSLDELRFTDTHGTCHDVADAELVPLSGTVYPDGTPDVIAHIRAEAGKLVRRVNPGCDYSRPWFPAKVDEVTEAMVRRICLDNVDAGRADLARKIRIAWERSA